MTIKNRKKNVSAENKKVLTDINLQNTVLNVDEDNFWDESQILKNIILPEASSTKEFGLMSKEDYNNIQYAFNKLNALEDDTGEYLGINFDTLADLGILKKMVQLQLPKVNMMHKFNQIL